MCGGGGGVVDDTKGELGERGEGGWAGGGLWWWGRVESLVSNEQSNFAPTTGDKEVATNTV